MERRVWIGILVAIGALALGVVAAYWQVNAQRAQQTQQFLAAADHALQSLERVAAAVDVGVGLVEFRTLVANAKVDVDRFLMTWPQDLRSPVRTAISRAMDEFVRSAAAWQAHFDDATHPSMEDRLRLIEQAAALQKQGVQTTREARRALNPP